MKYEKSLQIQKALDALKITEDTEDTLSWREKCIMDIIRKQATPIMTRTIYQVADMAKVTALKHLAVLKAKKLVGCIHIGPTKLWWVIEPCPKCGGTMQNVFMFQCQNCNHIKRRSNRN